jgi:biotin carboxyl carrier protein
MYKAHTGSGSTYEVVLSDSGVLIDSVPFDWDFTRIRDNHFHVIHEKKSYNVEVVSTDALLKVFTFKINGSICTIQLKDKFDELLEKLGMNGSAVGKINSIKAPMPGLIIDLRVKEGDKISAGDPLLILEAMKMENVIKAPGDAILKSLKVKKGDSVEKNQVLLEFE